MKARFNTHMIATWSQTNPHIFLKYSRHQPMQSIEKKLATRDHAKLERNIAGEMSN
jgi:hypothetical protein